MSLLPSVGSTYAVTTVSLSTLVILIVASDALGVSRPVAYGLAAWIGLLAVRSWIGRRGDGDALAGS